MTENYFNQIVQKLSLANIPSPRLETRILFSYVVDNQNLGCLPTQELTDYQKNILEQLIKRRLDHEPLDKIIGQRDFYKYNFIVNKNVLTPRPDSEILVEAAADLIKQYQLSTILDLGVGSGCLLLSLLADFPNLYGMGVDISSSALKVAQENACRLNVAQRVKLWVFDYLKDDLNQHFDLIIANPPYIPTEEINKLDPEVKNYDPWQALDGGIDGLKYYRYLSKNAQNWLIKNGYLVLEVGFGQADEVKAIFTAKNWQHIKTLKDLNGINRCIILKK